MYIFYWGSLDAVQTFKSVDHVSGADLANEYCAIGE